MKVKYPNQTAFCTITDDNPSTDGVKYFSLEENFPGLDSGDAIVVKKVFFNISGDGKDFEAPE